MNKRRWLAGAALAAGLALTGCITIPTGKDVGELPRSYDGQQVVIYRPMDAGGMYFSAMLDGQALRDSVTRGSVIISPGTVGTHSFTVALPPLQPGSSVNANTVTFAVAQGERKFIRVSLAQANVSNFTTMSGGYAGTLGRWNFRVEEVDTATGLRETKSLKFAS
ncbi:MAG: hypothetical protein Q7T70_19130 [Polaromonas sp.]|nr:hypothetical protein [Polaromonas sp.]